MASASDAPCTNLATPPAHATAASSGPGLNSPGTSNSGDVHTEKTPAAISNSSSNGNSGSNNSGSSTDPPSGANEAGERLPDADSRTTLWMGDLEAWMDEHFIKYTWASLGEQVNVKMIRDKTTGMPAGYCFVDFVAPDGAATALLNMNGTPIPSTSRTFRLNWATGGGISSGHYARGPEYSVFVGDLSPEVNDYMLMQAFLSQYPSVRSAKVVIDAMTNQSKGYGFVRFGDLNEQQNAMVDMQGMYLGLRPIRISPATPRNRMVSAGSQHQAADQVSSAETMLPSSPKPPVSNEASTLVTYTAPYAEPDSRPVSRSASQSAPVSAVQGKPFSSDANQQHSQRQRHHIQPRFNQRQSHPHQQPADEESQDVSATGVPNTTVFIGALPSSVTKDSLRLLFSPYGEIIYTKVPPGKGCGFVQFVEPASAELAIQQMNGFAIGGSHLRLSWGRSQSYQHYTSPHYAHSRQALQHAHQPHQYSVLFGQPFQHQQHQQQQQQQQHQVQSQAPYGMHMPSYVALPLYTDQMILGHQHAQHQQHSLSMHGHHEPHLAHHGVMGYLQPMVPSAPMSPMSPMSPTAAPPHPGSEPAVVFGTFNAATYPSHKEEGVQGLVVPSGAPEHSWASMPPSTVLAAAAAEDASHQPE